ncbi:MAG: hypothetical protein ACK4N4_12215 [Burkholderiales bacterium]
MSSLIHATITVSGDESQLAACDACIRLLLAGQQTGSEIAEHHGAAALCYDLKVRGGIPFPVFAQASQEFPALSIVAEWVDVDAGTRGTATIVEGKLTAHQLDRLALSAGSERPVHIAVAADGTLELALVFFRSNREEWLGYALTADRDALFRAVRVPGSGTVELLATDGGPQWCLRWRAGLAHPENEFGRLREPQEIDSNIYPELERMARDFVGEWMWFASGSQEEIAIEKERYGQAGYPVHAANVKTARLHRMRNEARERQAEGESRLRFSTVPPDAGWVVDIVMRCWAVRD